MSCAPSPQQTGCGSMFTSCPCFEHLPTPWGPCGDALLHPPDVCHHRRTGQPPSAHTSNRTRCLSSPPPQSGTSVTWIKKNGGGPLEQSCPTRVLRPAGRHHVCLPSFSNRNCVSNMFLSRSTKVSVSGRVPVGTQVAFVPGHFDLAVSTR